VRHRIQAPPGKLDVVVFTSKRGEAVVRKVGPGSPLRGDLQEGDVIVQIDGISVASHVDVGRVLSESVSEKRVFTVERSRYGSGASSQDTDDVDATARRADSGDGSSGEGKAAAADDDDASGFSC